MTKEQKNMVLAAIDAAEEYKSVTGKKIMSLSVSSEFFEALKELVADAYIDCILDEIKVDIERLDGMYVLRDHVFYAEKDPKHAGLWYVRLKEVINILDRYRIESEEGET